MRRTPIVVAAATLVAGVAVFSVLAQPQSGAQPPTTAAEKKKMIVAAMATLPGPSDQHKLLSPFVGEFDMVTELSVGEGDAISFHAVEKGQSIMGGLFVKVESTSAPDEELKGDRLIVYGFDPYTKKYTMWGVESQNPTSITATGDFDPATKTFTFEGEVTQPPAGEKLPFRWIVHVKDDGSMEQQIQMRPAAGEDFQKVVGVLHTPKKK